MTVSGHRWTFGRNRRESWALCPAGSAWLSSAGLELYGVSVVPLPVMDALWALWRAPR